MHARRYGPPSASYTVSLTVTTARLSHSTWAESLAERWQPGTRSISARVWVLAVAKKNAPKTIRLMTASITNAP